MIWGGMKWILILEKSKIRFDQLLPNQRSDFYFYFLAENNMLGSVG